MGCRGYKIHKEFDASQEELVDSLQEEEEEYEQDDMFSNSLDEIEDGDLNAEKVQYISSRELLDEAKEVNDWPSTRCISG